MRCGAATTRKETMRVVVKSEVVMRDRGWRCGGIVCGGLGASEGIAEASGPLKILAIRSSLCGYLQEHTTPIKMPRAGVGVQARGGRWWLTFGGVNIDGRASCTA
jgi:hypothetical protein